MTVYAITDTKKGRTGIAPTYLQVGAGAAFSNTAFMLVFSLSPNRWVLCYMTTIVV